MKVLAFDFGASSGRAIEGTFENKKIQIKEILRFENTPIKEENNIYWNTDMMFSDIKKAIAMSKDSESIGIDTWGVDYGLIGKDGKLLKRVSSYRDPRTNGILEKFEKYLSQKEIYNMTGIQIMAINTVFQLFYELQNNKELMEKVDSVLLMPDLFNYFLTGEKKSEMSICSTSQLMNPNTLDWNYELFEKIGLDKNIFPKIIKSGQVMGNVKEELLKELDIDAKKVIAVCGHDTASAVVSVPSNEDFLFISLGTWALFGAEIEKPVISELSSKYNLTNELGINGTVRFLKNTTGLWLIQETKRILGEQGHKYSYGELEKLGWEATPFKCIINPDDVRFQSPGDMPQRIRDFALETNQTPPETVGEIVRTINESIALKNSFVFSQMCKCLDKKYKKINIIGGGTQSQMLCQMIANASETTVEAGPIEATAIGNIVVQLMALGEIKDIKEAREIVKNSFETKIFQPNEDWTAQVEKCKRLFAFGDE